VTGPTVIGRTRDLVIFLDKLIYKIAVHWLLLANLAVGLYVGLPILAPVLMYLGLEGAGRAIYTLYYPACHQLPWRSFFLFGPKMTYSLEELIRAVGAEPFASLVSAKRFLGTPELGYKMAMCQRDIAIYGAILVTGVLYGLARRRWLLRPLPWRYFLILVLPLAVDASSQLLGLRESTWLLRTVTGALFGSASVLLAYPYVEEGFRDIRLQVEAKLKLSPQEQVHV